MSEQVKGRCPACGSGGLFVAAGDYVTCPSLECPNPSAPSEALGIEFLTPREPELSPLDALAEAMRLGHWDDLCEPYADVFPDIKERWQRSARAALRHIADGALDRLKDAGYMDSELAPVDVRDVVLGLDPVEYAGGAS